jgi:mannose-1-phosphate guanylyltransferase
MYDHYYAVIMAGGEGSRLWPLSRKSRPKQMVQLGSERTLFQMAVDRIREIFPPDHIYVVTVAAQADGLKSQCPEIPDGNYLLEPLPRGTASVVGFAAVALHKRDPQAVMAILAADHLIQNVPVFQQLLMNAHALALDGHLVTLGIRPTYAATGYGYIQRGDRLAAYPFLTYHVERFKEKPDEETAREFLGRGDHDWNSGMFIWRVDRILTEIEQWMPDLAEKLGRIAQDWGTSAGYSTLSELWPGIQPQTIDYGIMEKASQVVCLPAVDLGWNDVGTWESIFEVFQTDANGNVILDAGFLGISTANSLIVSDHTGRLIVTLGVENLIVVDTPDAMLVCSRDQSQRVKEIVNLLKQSQDAGRYL